MNQNERNRLEIESLPGNLWESLQITEKSDLVKKALGDHVFNSFIQNKKLEWENYHTQIADHEIKQYLPSL